MARIRITVRYTGAGWVVRSSAAGRNSVPAGRPYGSREEALADAVFASRMLEAMGEETTVLVEGSTGLVAAPGAEAVWRRH